MNRTDHTIARRLYENLPEQIPAHTTPFIQLLMPRGPDVDRFKQSARHFEIWQTNIRKNQHGFNQGSILILLFDGRSLVAAHQGQFDIWRGAASQFSRI
jgi:hypothetical protein